MVHYITAFIDLIVSGYSAFFSQSWENSRYLSLLGRLCRLPNCYRNNCA